MMSRFNFFLAPLLVLTALVFVVPAVSSAQPDIVNNLCAGANLEVGTDCRTGSGDAMRQLNHIIKLIINVLSLIVGIVAVVMIIIGGLRYITSGGSDTGVTGAKNTILYAIIGLVIVAMAQVIIRFVLNKLTAA